MCGMFLIVGKTRGPFRAFETDSDQPWEPASKSHVRQNYFPAENIRRTIPGEEELSFKIVFDSITNSWKMQRTDDSPELRIRGDEHDHEFRGLGIER
jgi:hypothetical protein